MTLVTISLLKKEKWTLMNTDTPALLQVTLKLAADHYWNDLSWNEPENCHLEPRETTKVKWHQS